MKAVELQLNTSVPTPSKTYLVLNKMIPLSPSHYITDKIIVILMWKNKFK